MQKKLLSILLAVCMLLSMMPMTVFATDDAVVEDVFEPLADDVVEIDK